MEPDMIAEDFLHSEPKTHPSSFDNAHIESFQAFANDLKTAIQRAFPALAPAKATRYTSVHVLLLRWADDDLGSDRQKEVEDLQNVFGRQFHFNTECWQIPNARPGYCLEKKLLLYQKAHQDPDELLIVYYGGQGQFDNHGRCMWKCNTKSGSPVLEWYQLQPILELATPDVLVLLDCCYAATSSPRRDSPSESIKEVLSACGRGFPSTGVGRISSTFTRVLIDQLKYFGPRPFTVAMLHNRIMNYRFCLSNSPIYALLLDSGKKKSITLSPLPQDRPSLLANGREDSPASREDSDRAMHLAIVGAVEALQSLKQPAPNNNAQEARVLMSVAIKDDARLDVGQFRQWMAAADLPNLNTPQIDVRLESVYQCPSVSRIALVSLPVSVWDMLSENPAYAFLGFVNSGNPVESQGSTLLPQYSRPHPDFRTPNGKFQQPQPDSREIRPRPVSINHDDSSLSMDSPDSKKRKRLSGPARLPDEKPAFTPINVSPPNERKLKPDTKLRLPLPVQPTPDEPTPPSKKRLKTHSAPKHGRRSPENQPKFPCTFRHYGCGSDFRSKNEWKRHVHSQHLRLGFWRCDVGACASSPHTNKPKTTSTSTGSAADFIRKDLFTQHHRRMHCPWPSHSYAHPPSAKAKEEFEQSLEEVRRRCWVKVRDPPHESWCGYCGRTFEGPGSWEERMEHVGRHLERGDFPGFDGGPRGIDEEREDEKLREWLLEEGLLEKEDMDGEEMGDAIEKEAEAQEEMDGVMEEGMGSKWRWKLVGAR